MSIKKESRREFLTTVGKGALTVAIAAPVSSSAFGWGKPPAPMQPILIDTAKPEFEALQKVGGFVTVPDPTNKKCPIIVVRSSDTDVTAFSSKCTHMGCAVAPAEGGTFVCPCHNSKFDMQGNVIGGPAKSSLKHFTAALGGPTITVQEKADPSK